MAHKGRLSKKKKKTVNFNLRKGVACPLCHADMIFAREAPGLSRDKFKNMIPVKRRIWICPNADCMNVVSFEYRLDGKEGDMHKKLAEEEHGLRKKRVTAIEGTNV